MNKRIDSEVIMICQKCKNNIPDTAKFCPKCGAKVEVEKPQNIIVCPRCGAENPLTARFCRKDGTPLKEEVKPPEAVKEEIKPEKIIERKPKEIAPIKARKAPIWIAISILIIILAGIGSYLYFSGIISQKAYKESISKWWKVSVSEYNALYNQMIRLGSDMEDIEKLKHILKVQLKSLDALKPISEVPENQKEFNKLLIKTLETQKTYYQKILEVLSLTEVAKEKLSSVSLLGKELEDLYEKCKEKMPELYPEVSNRAYIAVSEKLTGIVDKSVAKVQRERVIIVEKEKPEQKIYSGEFLCPDSDKRKLTEYDLRGKSAKELTLMRNEIYARHGRYFKRKEIREYFESQDWYSVNPDYNDGMLNSYEKYNVIFIREYQERYGLEY